MDEAVWRASSFAVDVEASPDGSTILRPRTALDAYLPRVTDALEQWAAATPHRLFVAQRGPDGEWLRVSYRQALGRVRAIASGLAGLELSPERPLAIMSGNSIDHLMVALAAMYVGVPYCPISPAYSQVGSNYSKLRYVIELLTPGIVVALDTLRLEDAITATVPADTVLIGDAALRSGRAVRSLEALESQQSTSAEAAHARVDGDTIAKFLLTSGSTGQPKAVITTHRMLCSNQIMLRSAMPFIVEEGPVLVDWLPWNHTYGGSHNVGAVLFNGGSLYIDHGKPMERAFRGHRAQSNRDLPDRSFRRA